MSIPTQKQINSLLDQVDARLQELGVFYEVTQTPAFVEKLIRGDVLIVTECTEFHASPFEPPAQRIEFRRAL